MQNGYIESFDGRFREECLNEQWFETLYQESQFSAALTPKDKSVSKDSSNGPLSGVKVIDLTGVIMGPFGTHILADMGADVVKIESPGGNLLRNYPFLRSPDMSGQVLHLNRNKRGVVLDLKSAARAHALRRLIERAG